MISGWFYIPIRISLIHNIFFATVVIISQRAAITQVKLDVTFCLCSYYSPIRHRSNIDKTVKVLFTI
jgi:hypothetical protein